MTTLKASIFLNGSNNNKSIIRQNKSHDVASSRQTHHAFSAPRTGSMPKTTTEQSAARRSWSEPRSSNNLPHYDTQLVSEAGALVGGALESAMKDEIAEQTRHLERLGQVRKELHQIAELKAALATTYNVNSETQRNLRSQIPPVQKLECENTISSSIAYPAWYFCSARCEYRRKMCNTTEL